VGHRHEESWRRSGGAQQAPEAYASKPRRSTRRWSLASPRRLTPSSGNRHREAQLAVSVVLGLTMVNIKSKKDDPNLFFFGNMVDIDCHLQDLKLVLKKTEEIDFDESEDRDQPLDASGLILDIFPDTVRKSFIVTLMILFEDEMRGFCELLREIEDIPLRWNQLRGSAIERFILYVQNLSSLDYCIEEKTLEQLNGLIEIRNCIVHSNSVVDHFGKKKTIEKFAADIDGIDIENGVLRFSFDACMTCADLVERFFESTYYAALTRYPDKNGRTMRRKWPPEEKK